MYMPWEWPKIETSWYLNVQIHLTSAKKYVENTEEIMYRNVQQYIQLSIYRKSEGSSGNASIAISTINNYCNSFSQLSIVL